MRTPLLLTFFFFFITLLSAQRTIKGSGDVVTQDRKVENTFNEIEAYNAIKVVVELGDEHSVKVEADDNLLEYIVTEVRGNTLTTKLKSGKNYRHNTKMIVHITMPELARIDVSGAAMVTSKSTFSGDKLRIDASGAARVEVGFNGENIMADVNGAAKVELFGSSTNADYEASGAGSIYAKAMKAKNVEASASSAGSIKLTATESLDAEANSAGSIRYDGNPSKIYTDSNSAGSISG